MWKLLVFFLSIEPAAQLLLLLPVLLAPCLMTNSLNNLVVEVKSSTPTAPLRRRSNIPGAAGSSPLLYGAAQNHSLSEYAKNIQKELSAQSPHIQYLNPVTQHMFIDDWDRGPIDVSLLQ